MARIKVRATVNVMGLMAGQEAEVELNDLTWSLLRAKLLLALMETSSNPQ